MSESTGIFAKSARSITMVSDCTVGIVFLGASGTIAFSGSFLTSTLIAETSVSCFFAFLAPRMLSMLSKI